MTPATTRNGLFAFFSGLFILSLLVAVWSDTWYYIAIPFAIVLFYLGWQYRNIVFFCLLFSLPFSAELQFSATLGTDFPDELLMLFTAGLFLCYWVYHSQAITRKTIQHPLMILLTITFIWSVIAAIFSTDHLLSIKFLLAKCWYIGAFVIAPLIVLNNKKTITTAVLALSIAMLMVVLVTIVRHYKYDFTFAGINPSLSPFFRNHVNYSAMLVCMIPVFFACYKLSESKKSRHLLIIVIIVLLAALFFTYARGAWLALFTGMIAWWLIKKRIILTAYVLSIILLIAFLFWIKANDRYLEYAHDYRTTIFHQNFGDHLRATYEFKDVSTAERFYRWIAGVRMIKDDPLTGFGPNTFYNNYKPYAIPAFKTWVSGNAEHSTVHNYFLMITIEQGIPGLFFFLLITGAMLYYAQSIYHRSKDSFYKMVSIITGVVLIMILTVNFLSDMIETDKVGSLFFLCLSVLIATNRISNHEVTDELKTTPTS